VGEPGRRRGRGGSRGGRARNAPMPSRPHRPGRRAKLAPFYTATARPATHPLGGSHLLRGARASHDAAAADRRRPRFSLFCTVVDKRRRGVPFFRHPVALLNNIMLDIIVVRKR